MAKLKEIDPTASAPQDARGFVVLPGLFGPRQQSHLVKDIFKLAERSPFFTPTMPRSGKPFSVAMTNFGPLGWVSDKAGGYRYQPTHPVTGVPWPEIPSVLLKLWRAVAGAAAEPEACLVNLYRTGTKMGSHQDRDESDFSAPVVSVSLGDDAVFHVGGLKRADPKTRVTLRSGDVAVLGGASRLAFHGIDRILAGTSDLIPGGGRINLTLRRVTKP